MTVPLEAGPQDLAGLRAKLNELITEFNAAIAGGGGGGVTFPLTAPDNAIALQGSDATSGFTLDAAGLPVLSISGGTASASVQHNQGALTISDALTLTGTSQAVGLVFTPPPVFASAWAGFIEFDAFGVSPSLTNLVTGGTPDSPTAVANHTGLWFENFFGYRGSGFSNQGAQIIVSTEEDFSSGHAGTSITWYTAAIGEGSPTQRMIIDGAGGLKQQNGVFALDTGGSDAGIAIASLPSSPTLGMEAVVNDAVAPSVGSAVAGTGAAKALVWWNGSQWTVMGI